VNVWSKGLGDYSITEIMAFDLVKTTQKTEFIYWIIFNINHILFRNHSRTARLQDRLQNICVYFIEEA